MSSLIDKAYKFAKEKHDATGKLYNGRPYIVHPQDVFRILEHILFFKEFDENLLAAAYLHDTLEDTDTNYVELVSYFNEDIADLVMEVTKDYDKDFPNLTTERGLILKVADRMANVSSLPVEKNEEKRKNLFRKYSYCLIHEGTHLKSGL